MAVLRALTWYISLHSARKERPVSLGIFQLPGGDVMTPDPQREQVETSGTDSWRYNDLSHPRSNTSLKVGKTHSLVFFFFPHQSPLVKRTMSEDSLKITRLKPLAFPCGTFFT